MKPYEQALLNLINSLNEINGSPLSPSLDGFTTEEEKKLSDAQYVNHSLVPPGTNIPNFTTSSENTPYSTKILQALFTIANTAKSAHDANESIVTHRDIIKNCFLFIDRHWVPKIIDDKTYKASCAFLTFLEWAHNNLQELPIPIYVPKFTVTNNLDKMINVLKFRLEIYEQHTPEAVKKLKTEVEVERLLENQITAYDDILDEHTYRRSNLNKIINEGLTGNPQKLLIEKQKLEFHIEKLAETIKELKNFILSWKEEVEKLNALNKTVSRSQFIDSIISNKTNQQMWVNLYNSSSLEMAVQYPRDSKKKAPEYIYDPKTFYYDYHIGSQLKSKTYLDKEKDLPKQFESFLNDYNTLLNKLNEKIETEKHFKDINSDFFSELDKIIYKIKDIPLPVSLGESESKFKYQLNDNDDLEKLLEEQKAHAEFFDELKKYKAQLVVQNKQFEEQLEDFKNQIPSIDTLNSIENREINTQGIYNNAYAALNSRAVHCSQQLKNLDPIFIELNKLDKLIEKIQLEKRFKAINSEYFNKLDKVINKIEDISSPENLMDGEQKYQYQFNDNDDLKKLLEAQKVYTKLFDELEKYQAQLRAQHKQFEEQMKDIENQIPSFDTLIPVENEEINTQGILDSARAKLNSRAKHCSQQLEKLAPIFTDLNKSIKAINSAINRLDIAGRKEKKKELGEQISIKLADSREASAQLVKAEAGYEQYISKTYNPGIAKIEHDFAVDMENIDAEKNKLEATKNQLLADKEQIDSFYDILLNHTEYYFPNEKIDKEKLLKHFIDDEYTHNLIERVYNTAINGKWLYGANIRNAVNYLYRGATYLADKADIVGPDSNVHDMSIIKTIIKEKQDTINKDLAEIDDQLILLEEKIVNREDVKTNNLNVLELEKNNIENTVKSLQVNSQLASFDHKQAMQSSDIYNLQCKLTDIRGVNESLAKKIERFETDGEVADPTFQSTIEKLSHWTEYSHTRHDTPPSELKRRINDSVNGSDKDWASFDESSQIKLKEQFDGISREKDAVVEEYNKIDSEIKSNLFHFKMIPLYKRCKELSDKLDPGVFEEIKQTIKEIDALPPTEFDYLPIMKAISAYQNNFKIFLTDDITSQMGPLHERIKNLEAEMFKIDNFYGLSPDDQAIKLKELNEIIEELEANPFVTSQDIPIDIPVLTEASDFLLAAILQKQEIDDTYMLQSIRQEGFLLAERLAVNLEDISADELSKLSTDLHVFIDETKTHPKSSGIPGLHEEVVALIEEFQAQVPYLLDAIQSRRILERGAQLYTKLTTINDFNRLPIDEQIDIYNEASYLARNQTNPQRPNILNQILLPLQQHIDRRCEEFYHKFTHGKELNALTNKEQADLLKELNPIVQLLKRIDIPEYPIDFNSASAEEDYDMSLHAYRDAFQAIPKLLREASVPQKTYITALNELKRTVRRLPPEATDLKDKTWELIKHIEGLHESGESDDDLIKVLVSTNSLLNGENDMTPEKYRAEAKTMQGKPSLGMKIMGGLMITVAALVIAAGITLAATGAGFPTGAGVAAVGVTVGAIGVGFFAKGKQRGLSKKMSDVEKAKEEIAAQPSDEELESSGIKTQHHS